MDTNIKKLREQRKISQAELARILNIARSTMCQYEKGNREADYETLFKLADYFNTSIDYLLCHKTPEDNSSTIPEEDIELKKLWSTLSTQEKWKLIGCGALMNIGTNKR